MDTLASSCLLIIPSSNTSCSASAHNGMEIMTSDHFMSAISSFQRIWNAETAEQGTQVAAPTSNSSAQTTLRQFRNIGCDPCLPQRCNASTSPPPPVVKKDVATHQVTHTVDVRTQTIKMEDEASVKVKIKVEKHDVAVETVVAETRDIGVDATIKSGIALPIPRQKVEATNVKDVKETKPPESNRRTSVDRAHTKLRSIIEHIKSHINYLQDVLHGILKDIPEEKATFTKRYVYHIAKVVSEFASDESEQVMDKDKRWMKNFKKNPLWNPAVGSPQENFDSSDGEIKSDDESTKTSLPTGIAPPKIRSVCATQATKSEERRITKRRRIEDRGREIPSRSVRPRLRSPPKTHRSPPSRFRPHGSPPGERSSKHPTASPRRLEISPRERPVHSRGPLRDEREDKHRTMAPQTHSDNHVGGGTPLQRPRSEMAPLRRTRSREETEQYRRIKTVEITKREDPPYRHHYPDRGEPNYPPPREYFDPSYILYGFDRRRLGLQLPR